MTNDLTCSSGRAAAMDMVELYDAIFLHFELLIHMIIQTCYQKNATYL